MNKSAEREFANPKGIPQQSPGLRGTSYPGKVISIGHNPERVVAGNHGNRTRPSKVGLAVIFLLMLCSGCRREMYDQPYYRPLVKSDLFANGMASRPVVANTVARGRLNEDEALFAGKIGTNMVETFPFEITPAVLTRGQQRFDIYCSPCHARTGEGNGMIVQRGFPPPPSYHIDRLRDAPVGHLYDVIANGYGIMYSYANRVSVEDRWAIAAYIRALQLSRNVRADQLPPEERARLEGRK